LSHKLLDLFLILTRLYLKLHGRRRKPTYKIGIIGEKASSSSQSTKIAGIKIG
jgi:hypothetical protein